jgi:Tol biopolymer transport system component
MYRRIWLGLTLTLLIACSDDSAGPTPDADPVSPTASSALVSAPVEPASAMRGESSVRTDGPRVFVSMPPGSEPGGTGVTIRVLRTDVSVSVPMVDGGFDPVAVEAVAGDSLAITVARPSGAEVGYARVPAGSKPVVVRTSPRHRRIDVPLNHIIQVVFNEPMDSASLVTTVRLRRGQLEVPGKVTGLALNGDILAAVFEPVTPLEAGTDYTLVISESARSRQGTPLAAPVQATFTTGDGSTAGAAIIVTVTTTGSDLDQDGYASTIWAGAGKPPVAQATIANNGSFTADNLEPGAHSIWLEGISLNCKDSESGPLGAPGAPLSKSVSVEAGQRATLLFEITCRPVGAGTLGVTTSTTGADIDADGYLFSINGGPGQAIGANATVTIPNLVDTAFYSVELKGVRGNCRQLQPSYQWWGVLAADAVTPAAFSIECEAATFTPAGTIAFVSATDNGSAIWISNADGTDRVQLTDGAAYDTYPTWSPDGQRLAFTRDENGGSDIYVMNADGSQQTRLTFVGDGWDPDWSPDGELIAFRHSGGVYVTAADPGARGFLQRVGAHTFLSGSPAWSPDGSRIAFVGSTPGGTLGELYVIDADGSGLRKVDLDAGAGSIVQGPAWSPDGHTIAVSVAADPLAGQVWLVNEDGSGSRVVAEGWSPVWSPDGSGLAFQRGETVRYVGTDGGASIETIESGADPAWRP